MLNKINISAKKQILIVYVVLAVVTLAVFWQVNRYNFINFDDNLYVTRNSRIQSGITLEGFRWALGTKYSGLWNPLVWLSFMLDYQLYGLNADGYHLTNLILHIFSTLMLFWLFHRMTGAVWKSAFVAAVFALHPLHVESVAWIAERKDVLSAFFWMLTLCLYVNYTEKPVIRRYLLVLLFFVCALLSKPMVVTLPIIMILLDYWPLSRCCIGIQQRGITSDLKDVTPVSTNQGKKKTKSKKETPKKNISPSNIRKVPENKIAGIIPSWQLWEKLPFFVLSAVLVGITFYNPNTPDVSYIPVFKQFPFVSRLANAPVAFIIYLEKTFWPQDMAIFNPFAEHIPLWQVMETSLLIIVITVFVISAAKRMPYIFVGWLWFAITIAPVIGIIQISSTAPYAMADRYHYLPSIGISIILAWGIPSLIKSEEIRKKILFPAVIAILAILAVLTWKQCGYWKDNTTLFNHALRVTKNNYVAHHNLGLALFDQGKFKEAVEHFSRAISMKQDEAIFRYNRGNAYIKLGQYKRAIADYNEAISMKPDYTDAYSNRGLAFASIGQYGRAIEDYDETIRRKPGFFNAYYNKACSYALQKNVTLACSWLREAISRGYNDWKHLQEDKDFDNIRNESCFLELIKESKK
jgi:Flp pilus assembly protein TadD